MQMFITNMSELHLHIKSTYPADSSISKFVHFISEIFRFLCVKRKIEVENFFEFMK